MDELEILEGAKSQVSNLNNMKAIDILLDSLDLTFDDRNLLYILKGDLVKFEKAFIGGLLTNEDIVNTHSKFRERLLRFVSEIEYQIHNKSTNTSCQIPINYHIPEVQLGELIDFINNTDKGVVVVYGPSGVGKSVFCSYLYNTPSLFKNKKWYNCDFAFSINALKQMPNFDVVVFDNLFSNHDIFKSDCFKKDNNCYIIISTCEKTVVDLLENYCADVKTPFNLISFDGFSPTNAFNFLRKSISSNFFNNEYLENLSEIICPLPILWQITLDILIKTIENKIHESNEIKIYVNENALNSQIFDLNSTNNIVNVSEKIVNSWFASKNINEKDKDIIWILSKIPMIGMSPTALHSLMDHDNEVIERLGRLKKIGLIKVYSNIQINNEQIIQVHELIKRINLNQRKDIEKFQAKYLDHINNANRIGEADIATKIDIIVLKIKLNFEKWNHLIDPYAFNRMMEDQLNLLQKSIPINSNSQIKSEWLARLFQPLINSKTECAVLIGLGQAISHLAPNRILGDTIWEGRNNYDRWASACCITAAVHHWTELNEIQKIEKKEDLVFWFRIEFWKGHSYDFRQADLDIASFLAGLCKLGFVEVAIEEINSLRFKNNIKLTHVSLLALILYLVDHRHSKTEYFFNKYFSIISPSSARKNLIDYANVNGYDFQFTDKYQRNSEEKHMGQSIAKMVGSENFSSFLRLRNETITYV